MSEAEKSKPNKESGTSTATSAPPPTPPAATTTSKVSSSSTTATTSSSSITSSSSTATTSSSTSNTTATTSSGSGTGSSIGNNAANSSSNGNAGSSSTTKTPSKPPLPLPPPPPPPQKSQPSSSGSSRRHQELSEPAICKTFAELMKDSECLDKAADYIFESLLEDAVMGVFLEVHHAVKTGAMDAIEGQPEDETAFKIVDTPNFDIFGMTTARKPMDCTCPNCDRPVAAARFAPHLEKCMGMGRKTSRTASRRLANAREGNSSYFSSNVSDDEDDADWSSEKRRKKIQTSRTNGSKKNGKAS